MRGRLGGTLAAAGLVTLVTVAAWQGWVSLDRQIEVVRIEGELTAAERARATELLSFFLPAGVLSVDTRGMRELLEAESWVDSVALWRAWPEGIRVDIRAETAVARWRDGALLSARGRIIEPLELVGADALPRLAGPDGSAQHVMQTFQRISDALRGHDLRIESLVMDEEGGVRARLREGPELILGERELGRRLARIDLLLRRQFSDGLEKVARIDARYDNGIAVAWHEAGGETGAAPRQLAKGF